MTINDFLLARIAEDEAAVDGASAGPWVVDDRSVLAVKSMGSVVAAFAIRAEDRDFVARLDPERVLAECAAKRAIVKWDAEQYVGYAPIRHLAAVYADHPDYDESWRQ